MTTTLEPVSPLLALGAPEGDTAALASILAHRLRSIVAGVQGYAELLADLLPDHERPLALHILDGTASIERILKDLLCYGRHPEPVFFPVSLGALVAQTVEVLGVAPERVRVTQAPIEDDRVSVDPVLFRQALLILLQNALEGSPEHTTVEVELTREAGRIGVHVANQTFHPVDPLARLFDPFVTSKPDRLGLGLTLARRIATSHGGSLEAVHLGRLDSLRFSLIIPAVQVV